MHYRRAKTPGATYFFTVVTFNRQHLFKSEPTIQLLRESFHTVKQRYPFDIDAIVILPDHLHCIWTLPDGDAGFSTRWRLIKSYFSRRCPADFKRKPSSSRIKKKEQAVWQRRFWEHQIRNEKDFTQHVNYIHYNPVSHGLVAAPISWPYSSFHQYVKRGDYPPAWGASDKEILLSDKAGME